MKRILVPLDLTTEPDAFGAWRRADAAVMLLQPPALIAV